MPFAIDVSNPADDALISGYPANERANRTTLKNIIIAEHDEASGHHKIPAGTKAARDAITDWPATGPFWLINSGTPPKQLQHRNASVWESILPYGFGTTTARDALTDVPTGYVWFNTITGKAEYWDGAAWQPVEVSQNSETESAAINGMCQVWQRHPAAAGVSCPSGADTYVMDRFYVLPTGGAATVNRATASLPTSSVSDVALEVVGAAGVVQVKVGTRIPGHLIKRLGALASSGKPVFWTAKIKHSGSITNITPTLKIYTTSQASDELSTKFAAANMTERRSTAFAAISAGNSATLSDTFDVADAAVIAGAAENGLEVALVFTGLTGSVNEKLMITDFWFGAGSVAPSLRLPDFNAEVVRCRSFFTKTFGYSTTPAASVGLAGTVAMRQDDSNDCAIPWSHGMMMRSGGLIVTYNPSAAGTGARSTDGSTTKSLVSSTAGQFNSHAVFQGGAAGTPQQTFHVHMTVETEYYD